MGQLRAWVPPRIGLLCTPEASLPVPAAPGLRHHRGGQEGDLPRMPAVPPASLPRRFSLHPEKEGPVPLSFPPPTPFTSEPAPACIPSPSPSLTFRPPGLVSRAGKQRNVGRCFSFPFSSPPIPTPPPFPPAPSLEKGVRPGKGGYELQGSVISGEKKKKAGRAVLGMVSHVSPYVTYKNCPFLPFLGSRGGAAEIPLPAEGG